MLKINPRLAVAISREHVQNIPLDLLSNVYCFENSEIIYDYATKFLVDKNFRFINELNGFIRMASAGGLIEKWRLNAKNGRNQNFFKRGRKTYRQFNISSLCGFLLLGYLIPIMVATFVFIIEKIVHKRTNVPKPSRFWRFVKILIDPERHFLIESKSIQ